MERERGGEPALSPSPWLDNVFRPAIIGAMIGSVAWSLAGLLRLSDPGLDITGLVVFAALVAVEAYFSYRVLAALRWDSPARLRFRASEWILIFLLLQVGLAFAEGSGDLLTRVRSLTDTTLAAFVLVVICWLLGTMITVDLSRIGEPPEQVWGYVTPLESLANRFLMVGAFLLLITGLSRIALADLLNLARPAVPGLVLNVLIYFALGVLLLGQVRYTALRQDWATRSLPVPPGLSASWVRYSLLFAAVVLLLAFVLPTEYTFGLLDILRLIVGVIVGLGTLLFWLVGLLLLVPLSWFGIHVDAQRPAAPAATPTLPAPPPAASGLDPFWTELAQSALFWAVILAVLIYALRGYLYQHPQIRDAMRRVRLFRFLRSWGATLWRWLRGYPAALSASVRQSLARQLAQRRLAPPVRPARAAGGSPRERIYHAYWSVLHRADREGFPRRPAQTPREYETTLAPAVPQAQPDLDGLTGAFIEARYSRHAIDAAQAEQASRHGRQVESALDRPPPPATGSESPAAPT